MKRMIFTVAGIAALSLAASAINIAVTPGHFDDSRVDLANTKDTRLVLTGSATAADMTTLQYMSTTISDIDMSALTIEGNAIPASMLLGAKWVTKVTLPASVTSIGKSAFAGSGIVSVSLPQSVTSIAEYAFADCPDLKEVSVYPESKASFGKYVFRNCSELAKVSGLTYLTEVPEGLFDGCGQYVADIPTLGPVTKIGAYAFRSTATKIANLENVQSVGEYAFAENSKLEDVVLSLSSLPTFGTGVFFKDTAFDSIPNLAGNIPSLGVANIGGKGNVTVSASHVPEAAYANNTGVETLVFEPSVSKIDAHAFRNMTGLNQVDVTALDANVPDVDSEAFSGLLNDEGRYGINLYVADGTNDKWAAHPVWSLFDITNTNLTGSSAIEASVTDLNVSRSGNTVTVVSSYNIDFVGIYSLSGMTLYEGNPATDTFSVEVDGADGVLVIKAVSNGIARIAKLK